MKTIRFCLLFLLLLINFNLFAQNWSLFNNNFIYNYSLGGPGEITHTLFADSFAVVGNDTTFYLNRVISPCDTCSRSGYYLKNQPQFMQQAVIVSDNIYMFRGSHNLNIYPHAGVNDSWLFDSLNSITATVTDYGPLMTFNQPDSFKLIGLSNGSNLVISKKFGIVQFPDLGSSQAYLLVGIKGPNVGKMVPLFNSFFNFYVGDVFQYEIIENQFGISNTTHFEMKKVTFLSKSYDQGTFTYQANVQIKGWYQNSLGEDFDFYYDEFTDTLIFTDSSNHICNSYNQSAIQNFNMVDPLLQPDSIMFGRVNCFIDYDSRWTKGMPGTASPTGPDLQVFYSSQYDNPNLHHDLLTVAWYQDFEYLFKTGLGEVSYSWWWHELDYSRKLIGYVMDSDTMGLVYDNAFYINIDENNPVEQGITISPNPFSDHTIISVDKNGTKICAYELISIQGQVIRQIRNLNNHQIVIERKDLNAGCYFLKVWDRQENLYQTKLIIIN